MELGLIGLGRMGANMARRLMRGSHRVTVYDRDAAAVDALKGEGFAPAYRLEELTEQLAAPRAVWLMVPAGEPVTETIHALVPLLEPGDTVI